MRVGIRPVFKRQIPKFRKRSRPNQNVQVSRSEVETVDCQVTGPNVKGQEVAVVIVVSFKVQGYNEVLMGVSAVHGLI